MAEAFHRILLLLLLLSSSLTICSSSHPSKSSVPPNAQINNIIEALVGAGDFGNWASILSATDPSTFPVSATLFIPNDGGISDPPSVFNPSTVAYHIVPQQLSFSDLQLFQVGSRMPTLLPSKTILVTNNTRFNYTIDNSRITHPDIYINGAVAVHGIESVLNFTLYGDGVIQDDPKSASSPDSADTGFNESPSSPGSAHQSHSDAPCLCTEIFPSFSWLVYLYSDLRYMGITRFIDWD